jgi:hypothetical protein
MVKNLIIFYSFDQELSPRIKNHFASIEGEKKNNFNPLYFQQV